MILQLLNSDWPANILAGFNFLAKENGLMSPDGACAISTGLAGHKTKLCAALLYLIPHYNNVIIPSTAEIYHFQHERVTDFRKMFQNMLRSQITIWQSEKLCTCILII